MDGSTLIAAPAPSIAAAVVLDDQASPRMNKRSTAKAKTRTKVIDGAKALWKEPGTYHTNGIREIAVYIGMSTGAVFANFASKDELWRAAFECEPPVDSVLTRAAPALHKALQDLVDVMSMKPEDQPLFPAIMAADLLDRLKNQLLDEEAARSASSAEHQPSSTALHFAA